MAKITNAFTTYDAKANREDLSNAIYNIDPFDTPMMSMARRRKVKNRTYDWQTENLPVADENNAEYEGFELSRSASTPTVRQTNVCQISKRDATVSGSQEASDPAGKRSEMAHQMAMKSKVLKSDMEKIMCSRQARVDGDSGTPRKTESFPHAIARAIDRNAVQGAAVFGYVDGLTTEALPTTATATWTGAADPADLVELTELMLNDAMERAYNNGAKPDTLLLPTKVRRGVSNFTGRNTTQVNVGRTEVVATVDIIATDFGRIKVLPSRWLPTDIGMLVDKDYVAVSFFRQFRQVQIAKVGDAETRMILAEWGTETRNGMAHILFNGVKAGTLIGAG